MIQIEPLQPKPWPQDYNTYTNTTPRIMPIECGKCSSSNYEKVNYKGKEFKRCRACGHESNQSKEVF